ncbi:MAG: hypothetical protein RLZZ387_3724 [Chloroflexota bacterium]
MGLRLTRDDTSAAGAGAAFGIAMCAWAWQELACAPRRARRRVGFALETSLGQELAWALFVAGCAALTWDGANLAARWTLPTLWLLHLSMRLNALAQYHAGASGPLLRPPWFAPGLPAAQLLSAVFPLTVTAGTAASVWALDTALAQGGVTGEATGLAMIGAALAGGMCGHWAIVLRLPRWELPPLPRSAAPPLPRQRERGQGVRA